ncbi:STAS domain-containing protein [Quadrisphaera sp. KR29]|uniref:STAS domain-containing protein n=1 Tax=Quadrisphaera sp. KR29 TaxID=3461391 RepID=UPI0040445D1A
MAGHAGSALVRWAGHQPVVVLSGDLDMSMTGQLGAVGRLLRHWPHPVLTDAAGVAFVDVCGLRAVLALSGPGAPVVVRRPSEAVLRLLQLVGGVDAGVRVEALADPPGSLALTGLPGW